MFEVVPCSSRYALSRQGEARNVTGREADRVVDEICRDSGIRLITIDRPGTGHVPSVSLAERLDISCSQSVYRCTTNGQKRKGS
jgi:hypothetical protein